MNFQFNKHTKLFKIRFGFYPYSLIDESGSKIRCGDGSTNKYILDPEISYIKKMNKKIFNISITEKVDLIFDTICKKIDEVVGGFTGLRFFLRRTLGGCEFGVCIDLCIETFDNLLPHCLIDTEPLLLFTIQTKSFIPILAGILFIVLVYTTKVCELISTEMIFFIGKFKKVIKEGFKIVLYEVIKIFAEDKINELFSYINDKLINNLKSQIEKMRKNDPNSHVAYLLSVLSDLFNRKEYSNFNLDLLGKLGINFKINNKVKDKLNNFFPHLLKVVINILLCIVAFFMNFRHQNAIEKKYNEEKEAKEFDINQCLNKLVYDKIEKTIISLNPLNK